MKVLTLLLFILSIMSILFESGFSLRAVRCCKWLLN
jgi:hypothetical protein